MTREDENLGKLGLSHLWMICSKSAFSLYANSGLLQLLVMNIGHVKVLSNGQILNSLNVTEAQLTACGLTIFFNSYYKQIDVFGMRKNCQTKEV